MGIKKHLEKPSRFSKLSEVVLPAEEQDKEVTQQLEQDWDDVIKRIDAYNVSKSKSLGSPLDVLWLAAESELLSVNPDKYRDAIDQRTFDFFKGKLLLSLNRVLEAFKENPNKAIAVDNVLSRCVFLRMIDREEIEGLGIEDYEVFWQKILSYISILEPGEKKPPTSKYYRLVRDLLLAFPDRGGQYAKQESIKKYLVTRLNVLLKIPKKTV